MMRTFKIYSLSKFQHIELDKSSFRFFCKILWKNLNKFFGQHNTELLTVVTMLHIMCIYISPGFLWASPVAQR